MITDKEVKEAVARELKPFQKAADNWHKSVINALAALKQAIGGKE